jgi:hypothetical protein
VVFKRIFVDIGTRKRFLYLWRICLVSLENERSDSKHYGFTLNELLSHEARCEIAKIIRNLPRSAFVQTNCLGSIIQIM